MKTLNAVVSLVLVLYGNTIFLLSKFVRLFFAGLLGIRVVHVSRGPGLHDCWSRSRGDGLDRNKDAVNRVHKILGSDISSRIDVLETGRPVAEILVEGELSPFEHEALYKLLKKHFRLEQPGYSELLDETIGTRVNITFHHPYDRRLFMRVLQGDWR